MCSAGQYTHCSLSRFLQQANNTYTQLHTDVSNYCIVLDQAAVRLQLQLNQTNCGCGSVLQIENAARPGVESTTQWQHCTDNAYSEIITLININTVHNVRL